MHIEMEQEISTHQTLSIIKNPQNQDFTSQSQQTQIHSEIMASEYPIPTPNLKAVTLPIPLLANFQKKEFRFLFTMAFWICQIPKKISAVIRQVF